MILIAGEPGIGKSQLADVLSDEARDYGARSSSAAAGRPAARPRSGRGSRRSVPVCGKPSRRPSGHGPVAARQTSRRCCLSFATSCPTSQRTVRVERSEAKAPSWKMARPPRASTRCCFLPERYAMAAVEASFGSIARGLGVLAAKLERFETPTHFDTALEIERTCAPVARARQHDMARCCSPAARAASTLLTEAARRTARDGDLGGRARRAPDALRAVGRRAPVQS